jgi:hypothetical protein
MFSFLDSEKLKKKVKFSSFSYKLSFFLILEFAHETCRIFTAISCREFLSKQTGIFTSGRFEFEFEFTAAAVQAAAPAVQRNHNFILHARTHAQSRLTHPQPHPHGMRWDLVTCGPHPGVAVAPR